MAVSVAPAEDDAARDKEVRPDDPAEGNFRSGHQHRGIHEQVENLHHGKSNCADAQERPRGRMHTLHALLRQVRTAARRPQNKEDASQKQRLEDKSACAQDNGEKSE